MQEIRDARAVRVMIYNWLYHQGTILGDETLVSLNQAVNNLPEQRRKLIIDEFSGNVYSTIKSGDERNWFFYWVRESQIDWIDGRGFEITQVSKKLGWWGILLSIKSWLNPSPF